MLNGKVARNGTGGCMGPDLEESAEKKAYELRWTCYVFF